MIYDLPVSALVSNWLGCVVDISAAVAAVVVVTAAVVSASSVRKKINRLTAKT